MGLDAFRFLARESVLVSQLSEQLKAPVSNFRSASPAC